MRWNTKGWNKMVHAPSYYDDSPYEKHPHPDTLFSVDGWEVYKEGHRVVWRREPLYMGEFIYSPKSFSNEGSEFPEEWPPWLVNLFIAKMRDYYPVKLRTSFKYRSLLTWTD
jgi:hypothetical protein